MENEVRSEVYNINCIDYMKSLPDKCFDLVIADPPYGIKEDGKKNHSRGCLAKSQEYTPKDWDKEVMPKEFFDEMIRVSKNQIIWGANHFISRIPYDSPCWIVWDKDNDCLYQENIDTEYEACSIAENLNLEEECGYCGYY